MEDKKKILLVFIVAIFLVLIVSATYAYFAVSTVNNFGTSTINAQAGGIGTVTLNGNNAQLNLSVTALDMVQGNSDITYYASSSGKTTTETEEVIGTASVTPSTDTNYYHCTYTLSVTHSGTNDMYTVFSSAANKSAGQIFLTINGTDYDFYNGWPTNNQVQGDFYTTVSNPASITAGLKIINKSNINQNYLANTDIQITISLVNNSLSCSPEIAPAFVRVGTDSSTGLPVVRSRSFQTEEFYDITNLMNLSGNNNYAANKSILLARYNLYVGQICTNYNSCTPISTSANGYGLQSSDARGFEVYAGTYPTVGVVPFSGSNYWSGWTPTNDNYSPLYNTNYVTAPDYSSSFDVNGSAANSNYSIAYYVENYIDTLGIDAIGSIPGNEEYNAIGSTNWNSVVSGRNFWMNYADSSGLYCMFAPSGVNISIPDCVLYYDVSSYGVRPVIIINTSDIAS
jgi:hypothetical protein